MKNGWYLTKVENTRCIEVESVKPTFQLENLNQLWSWSLTSDSMVNPNIIQLSEFDITQKIIESLSNVCTRTVLFWIKTESKDATQIADELKISISTVYKTLSVLEDLALVEVERYVISTEGKKIKQYRSRIGKVEITLESLEPSLSLHPNNLAVKHDL